jgi:hypothetical protein
VCITANLLGCVEKLGYSDHDVTDTDKFLEFSKQVYLENMGIGPFGEPILQPKQWDVELANTGILKLLDIPHFGRGHDVNNCVKKLMEVTQGGYLWVEEPILIDVERVVFISGLPSLGEILAQFLNDKTKEKVLVEEMKKTYGTERGSCRIIIKCISDVATRLATKLMACKFLRNCLKEEDPVGVIAAAARKELCLDGPRTY